LPRRCIPQRNKRGTTVSVPSTLNLSTPAFRVPVAREIGRRLFHRTSVLVILLARLAGAQIDTTSIAPHRYLVLYRDATIPGDAAPRVPSVGAHLPHRNEHFGIAAVESQSPLEDDAATLRRLASQPNVEYVLHDRIVSAHRLRLQKIAPASVSVVTDGQSST